MNQTGYHFRGFLIALTLVMFIGVLGFMIVEDLGIGDAVYFSIVTVSTVGYGDVYPKTQIGKIIVTLMIIAGTGSFLGIIASVTEMLVSKRERQMQVAKRHMLIGVFFDDVGTELLTYLSDSDPNLDKIKQKLLIEGDWTAREFEKIRRSLIKYPYDIDMEKMDIYEMKKFLKEKRNFLLRLLENPLLFEHEVFSELLRTVFHLSEELSARKSLDGLPESDLMHIKGDIKRIYTLLARQWLDYMKYLKSNYPYLFSLAIRTNPFDENSSPIIE